MNKLIYPVKWGIEVKNYTSKEIINDKHSTSKTRSNKLLES